MQHAFFDSATRVVIIDVPFYNANLGQFISLTFIVDMPPGAGLITYSLSAEHSAFPLRVRCTMHGLGALCLATAD